MNTFTFGFFSLLICIANAGITWNAGGLAPNAICFLNNNGSDHLGCLSGDVGGLIGAHNSSYSKSNELEKPYRNSQKYQVGYGYESATDTSYLSSDSTFSHNLYAYVNAFVRDWRVVKNKTDIVVAKQIMNTHDLYNVLRKGATFFVVFDEDGTQEHIEKEFVELIEMARSFNMQDPECNIPHPYSKNDLNNLEASGCNVPTTTMTTTSTTPDASKTTSFMIRTNDDDSVSIDSMVSIVTILIGWLSL